MQPNAASMEDQKSRNPIKVYKQIITKDSNHRNAEEEACARELLELGQESGSPLSIVVQDNSSNKNNNVNGSNIKRVVMKVPHNSLNQVIKQNNILINFPNLDGTVDEDDGDEPSTNHAISKGIEAKTSQSPTTSISGVTQTLLNDSPSSAQYTNSESSLKICNRNASMNCANVVSVPHLTNQNDDHRSEYQKSDSDTKSTVTIENRVIGASYSPEKTSFISSSEPNFTNQLHSKNSDRLLLNNSESNDHKSNSALIISLSNDTRISEGNLVSPSNLNSIEAVNSSNKTSPVFSSSLPLKPAAPSKTKALSLFSIESLVSKDSSGVRYSSKQLTSPVAVENSNEMNPVNLSTKPSAQSQNQLANDFNTKSASISLQASDEAKDSQVPIQVPTYEPSTFEKKEIQPDSSCSKTADDVKENHSKSIFGNKNASKLASSTFSLLPNFNILSGEAPKNEVSKKSDAEPKTTVLETIVTDTMPKEHITKSNTFGEKCDSDTKASSLQDTVTQNTSYSQSSDKTVKANTSSEADDTDTISQNRETASENKDEPLKPSEEDSNGLENSKQSEHNMPKPEDDIKPLEVNQLHLDVKENTQSLKSTTCPTDIAASSQTTLLYSTKEENQEEEIETNCDVNRNDAKVSEGIQDSSEIVEQNKILTNPEKRPSLEEELLEKLKDLSEEGTDQKTPECVPEVQPQSTLLKSELQTPLKPNIEKDVVETNTTKGLNNISSDEGCNQPKTKIEVERVVFIKDTSSTSVSLEQESEDSSIVESAHDPENHKHTSEIDSHCEAPFDVQIKRENQEQDPNVTMKGTNNSDTIQKIVQEGDEDIASPEAEVALPLSDQVRDDEIAIQKTEKADSDLSISPTHVNLTNEPLDSTMISNLENSESKPDLIEQNVQSHETPAESSEDPKEFNESEFSAVGSHVVMPNFNDSLTSESNTAENDPSSKVVSALLDKPEKSVHQWKDISEPSDDDQLVISLPSPPKDVLNENDDANSEEESIVETPIKSKDDNLIKSDEGSEDKRKSQDLSHENDTVEKTSNQSDKENLIEEEMIALPHSDSQPFNSSEKISLELKNDSSVELFKGDSSPKEHLSESALDGEISEVKGEKSPCTTTCDTTTSSITLTTISSSLKETDVPLNSSIENNSETSIMQQKVTAIENIENGTKSELDIVDSAAVSELGVKDDECKQSCTSKNNEINSDTNSENESIIIGSNTKSEGSHHDIRHSSSFTKTTLSVIAEKYDKVDNVTADTKIENTAISSKLSESQLNSNENNNLVQSYTSDQSSSDNSSSLSESFSVSSSSSLATKSILPIVSQSLDNENKNSNDNLEKDSTTIFATTNSIKQDISSKTSKETQHMSKVMYYCV